MKMLGLVVLIASLALAQQPRKISNEQRIVQLIQLNRLLTVQKARVELELRDAELRAAERSLIAEYAAWRNEVLKDAKAEARCAVSDDGEIVCTPAPNGTDAKK